MKTMTLLTVALSETPTTSRPVTAAMPSIAGRFMIPWPTTTPFTLIGPVAVSACGIVIPRLSCRRLVRYPDHPTATVEAASPYSSSSSRPMIQATISPMDA